MSMKNYYGVGTSVKFVADEEAAYQAAIITSVHGDEDDTVDLIVAGRPVGKTLDENRHPDGRYEWYEVNDVPLNSNDDPEGPYWLFPTEQNCGE